MQDKTLTMGQLLKLNTIPKDLIAGAAIFRPSDEFPPFHSFAELAEFVNILKPRDVSQNAFMDGYNAHREAKGLPTVEESGWCHGLTLYWLKKMAKGQEKAFFEGYNSLIAAPQTDKDSAEKEAFYNKIIKCQRPWTFIPNATQDNLEKIYGLPQVQHWYDKAGNGFSKKKLQDILKEVMANYDMIRISAVSDKNHTIGMFISDDKISLFDCNDTTREGTTYKQFAPLQAAHWIQTALYTNLKLPTPRHMLMKLVISGIHSSELLQKNDRNQVQPVTTTTSTIRPTFNACQNKRKLDVYESASTLFKQRPEDRTLTKSLKKMRIEEAQASFSI